MHLLEMQTTHLDMIETEKVVSGWLTRYGKESKGIVSADDSGAQLGIDKTCQNAGREDIIRVAAGNSKVGREAIKAGELHAITRQSAEADGAIPMYLAVKRFEGDTIPEVQYLLKQIITAENVAQYLPPQCGVCGCAGNQLICRSSFTVSLTIRSNASGTRLYVLGPRRTG